jgi:hypothetical protein
MSRIFLFSLEKNKNENTTLFGHDIVILNVIIIEH